MLMSEAARRLELLSQVVLQLHRGSREWPVAAFAPRACELLNTLMHFDACLWGSVRADSEPGMRLSMQGLYFEGLSPEALADCLAGEGPPAALKAAHIEPLAGRRVELRLWRNDSDTEADDSDRQTLQFLMPHLVEAQRENRLSRAYEAHATAPARRSHVLCDTEGVLQQVDEQGLALLRSEWPRWCSTRLPEPLARAISLAEATSREGASQTQPFHGRQVTVLLTRSGEAWLLEVRRRGAVDRLSTRQRDIATLYAEGQTGPQIAAHLGLSPSTVNNHLGVIFKKLAVSNKVQLLNAMKK
jgi:DNA-binding CsgD family transcriptional regulator